MKLKKPKAAIKIVGMATDGAINVKFKICVAPLGKPPRAYPVKVLPLAQVSCFESMITKAKYVF